MPSPISAIVATFVLLAVSNASPVQLQRRTFSLSQVERTKILKNGPEQKARTFAKYGVKVPANVLAAAAARAEEASSYAAPINGSVPAVPWDEYDSL